MGILASASSAVGPDAWSSVLSVLTSQISVSTIARPFNIATTGEVSEAAQDFINYIMSAEGQAVITENGYIGDDAAAAFESNGAEGKVVVGGSSSVSPVMEKLIEAYKAVRHASVSESFKSRDAIPISNVPSAAPVIPVVESLV